MPLFGTVFLDNHGKQAYTYISRYTGRNDSKKKDNSRKLARVIKLSWRGCAMTQRSWKYVYKEAIMAALQDKVQQNCSTGTKFTDRYS